MLGAMAVKTERFKVFEVKRYLRILVAFRGEIYLVVNYLCGLNDAELIAALTNRMK